MRIVDLVSALAFGVCAFAQSASFSGVTASKDRIGGFTIETRIEPPSSAGTVNGIAGGVIAGNEWFHRYLMDANHKKYFGYDFLIEPIGQTNTLRVTLRPLSLAAEKLGLKEAKKWALLPPPRNPVSQTVNGGETIALDLMINPATGQRIVDYLVIRGDPEHTRRVAELQRELLMLKRQRAAFLTSYTPKHQYVQTVDEQIAILEAQLANLSGSGQSVPGVSEIQDQMLKLRLELAALSSTVSPKHPKVTALNAQMAILSAELAKLLDAATPVTDSSGSAHDFKIEDAELRIMGPRLTVNGKHIDLTNGPGVTGPNAWIYLAGYGRFTFSLAPRNPLGYRKAGEVRGSAMTFTVAGNTYVLSCDGRIAPGPDAYNLYVRHEPAYKPNGADANARFLQGAGR